MARARSNQAFIGPCEVRNCSWCESSGILRHAVTGVDLAGDDADQELRSDPAGVEGVVRLRAVADDRRADLHHLARDVGVVVEAEHDRHVRPEDRAAERDLLALDIVDAIRRAGAVQLQREPVDRPAAARPAPDALLEVAVGLARDAAAGDRPAPDDRNRLDGEDRIPRPPARWPPIWPMPRSFATISSPSKMPKAS